MITLTIREQPTVPLEAELLSPDVVAPLSNGEIRALPVQLGKRQCRVDDFFTVEGEAGEEIEIRGDLSKVKWIGHGMTRGRVSITGNAGMHLGASMKGGTIEVSGDVTDWLGAEMSGGIIRVTGNAGGQVGAAYRGSASGMTDGTILIGGSAGLEVGMRMKRGIIAIGTIVSLRPIRLLPTFAFAATYNPVFLRLYARHLTGLGFTIPYDDHDGAYQRYTGDASVPGKGEILVWAPRTS